MGVWGATGATKISIHDSNQGFTNNIPMDECCSNLREVH